MRYVCIGNSAGAVGAAEAIRKYGGQGEIVFISDEPHHTYSRPLISYLLLGRTTEERMRYRGASFYDDLGIELKAPVKAVAIDLPKKRVILEGGEEEPYDKLLVATGSLPFIPAAEGLNRVKKVFSFMSLDDAKALEKAICPESRVLIIGAGLIGLKCAESLLERVKGIDVVDLAPRILSSILDEEGALIVQRHLADKGVAFHLAQSASSFEEGRAILSGGRTLDFDILVMAVGVKPNVDLAKAAGLEVGRGIIVNSRMETSAPDVYAAGDCTQSVDASSGVSKIMALLPNAYMQGECAGANMAGEKASFTKAISMNAIGFFGLHILTAGTYAGDSYLESDGNRYKKLFYSGNRLNGFILIGSEDRAGVYTSLIRDQTPLDEVDFDLLCRQPSLAAFARQARAAKLGGAQ
ncbi:MAG: FAD-dependent oxidoreductase [Clostridiales bacterium]|nr:FAD-dependent oxidoreductase [Clostridiales bacterium]